MRSSKLIMVLLCAGALPVANRGDPKLLDLPLDRLPPLLRMDVIECQEDIDAVLAEKDPVHARRGVLAKDEQGNVMKDGEGRPLYDFGMADGGTTFWTGDGYTLTVWKKWVKIGDVRGTLFGPEVRFSKKDTGIDWPSISFVRFIAWPETGLPKQPVKPKSSQLHRAR